MCTQYIQQFKVTLIIKNLFSFILNSKIVGLVLFIFPNTGYIFISENKVSSGNERKNICRVVVINYVITESLVQREKKRRLLPEHLLKFLEQLFRSALV